MTVPAPPAPGIHAALGTLRASGRRVSAARRLVLEALYAADGPVTAQEIASGLGGRLPCSDLGSVYRNLDTLERLGLARHFHVGHAAGRYAPAGGPEPDLVACERCGGLEVVPPGTLDRVRELVERELGYRPRFSRFPLVVTCGPCSGALPPQG
jgi:Fur family ferric uptake transcriptional regulator